MDDQASRQQRVENALEICRPDGRDADDAEFVFLAAEMAADPRLADRYERIQRMDARITAAMREAPVADDLAERLLARVAPKKSLPEVSRRWLLFGSGLLTAAAALFVAVWLGFPRGKPLSEQYVLDEAIRFFGNAQPQSQPWLSTAPPGEYPFSAQLMPGREMRWQNVADFLGRGGVAYDLSDAETGRATLYVVACAAEGIGSGPALQPFTTGGCSASAWRENGLVYVLVAQGDPATYQRHLRLPAGPIA